MRRLGAGGRGEQPSLSVVIPYYRGAAVIGEAVESVLAQTLRAAGDRDLRRRLPG